MKTIKLLLLSIISLAAFNGVSAQGNAAFSYNIAIDSCWEQLVQFSDASTNVPPNAVYVWDFGDNNFGTVQNPSNWYYSTAPTTYIVTLEIYVGQTLWGTYSDQLILGPNFNQVGMTYNGQSGCSMPQAYSFVGTESDPNNPITSWSWTINGQFVNSSQGFTYTFNQSGTYQVSVEGFTSGGCSTSFTETIIVGGSNMVAGIGYQTISSNCNEAIVDLYSTVSGGTPPYTYSWNWAGGASTTANPQQALIYEVSPEVYLMITDSNGCSISVSETIQFNNSFFGYASSSPSSSCGQSCDGSITASATGSSGGGNYTFVLVPGNVTQQGNQVVYSNLCPGTYQVEVFDSNNCSDLLTVIVDQDSLSQVWVDATVVYGSACSALTVCDNTINAIAGNGVAPYQYSIDGGSTYQTSDVFTSVCAGQYLLEVIDANGCSGSFPITIQGNQSLGIQAYEYYDGCDSNSQGNGSFIEVYAYGGSAPYTYQWSDGSTNQTNNNLTPGAMSVIVTDANGCTFSQSFTVPTTDCFTISGNVYMDMNSNCIYDSGDYPLSAWVDLTATAGGPWLWIYDYTDANGHYNITAPAGTYFFDVNGSNVNSLTQSCPGLNYSVTLDANNPNQVVDFFFTPPAPVQDLSVSIGHITNVAPSTIPSQNRWSYITYCNDGTIPMSGSVVWNYSPELIYAGPGWTNITPDVIDVVNHALTFNFSSLAPGQCEYVRINFDVPNSMQIGTVIDDEVIINPIAGDVTPANNTAYSSELSVGSWDPNDKAVYPQGDITVDDNDHHYHIRFQNEGNANATRVIIKDELDANLDLHSLRNVQASHDYIMTVENNNELVFTFNNIQLPPKDVDEAASQGFVSFTLTQDGELPIGTQIENTAAIYFDFNPAVITNTVVNTIVEKTVGISDEVVLNALNVSPNPSTGVFAVNLNAGLEAISIKVYDMLGNVVMEMPNTKSNQIIVNLQSGANGIYFLEVETKEGRAVQKLVKKN